MLAFVTVAAQVAMGAARFRIVFGAFCDRDMSKIVMRKRRTLDGNIIKQAGDIPAHFLAC